jgi:Family of unknown function (DUF6325)
LSDLDETGTIDWFLIEFHGKEINGELVPPLLDLVDRRLIRILDAPILIKRADGSFDALTTEELDPSQVGELGALRGHRPVSSVTTTLRNAASVLDPDTAALLRVYENLWSVPFTVKARKAGGQLVAGDRIPTQAILARLDALEA